MKEKIGKLTLDYTWYPGQDFYSDGPVEEQLLDIAKKCDEAQLNGAIKKAGNWPVLYHFSHLRTNILEWVPMTKADKVLEIGAGCGAVTGVLAGKAGFVQCIELSKRRSLINAYRHQDCDNVEILVGNFQDIEPNLQEKYDVITLIGVLEYAALYIGGTNPYTTFLEIIKKHLAPGGRVLIAIENKLGLKYWAGCGEDHSGQLFQGLEGYPEGGNARTFSKKELEALAQEAGYVQSHFYYPYPDYKLPTAVYSDTFLPATENLTDNLRNFDYRRMFLFDEARVYEGVVKEGLFPQFSNSFMVMLQTQETPKPETAFVKYSNERDDRFKIRTEIRKKAGEHCVLKAPLTKAAHAHVQALMTHCQRLKAQFEGTGIVPNVCQLKEDAAYFEFLKGKSLKHQMDEALKLEDKTGFKVLFMDYIQRLKGQKGVAVFEKTTAFTEVFGDTALPEGLEAAPYNDIDIIFDNIIIAGDTWHLIDYEWTFDFLVPLSFIIYRALFYYIHGHRRGQELEAMGLYELAGIRSELRECYQKMETSFQAYMAGGQAPLGDLYKDITPGMLEYAQMIPDAEAFNRLKQVQIYPDSGQGYSEETSYTLRIMEEGGILTLDIPVAGLQALRIDPCNTFCLLKIESCTLDEATLSLSHNGIDFSQDCVLFLTQDPQLHLLDISDQAKVLHLVLRLSQIAMGGYENRGILLDAVQQTALDEVLKTDREKAHQLEIEKGHIQEHNRQLLADREALLAERANLQKEREVLLTQIQERDNAIADMKNTKAWRLYEKYKALLKK